MKNNDEQQNSSPAESNKADLPKPTTVQDADDLVHSETGKVSPGQLASMDPDDAVHGAAAPPEPDGAVHDVDDLLHEEDSLDDEDV